MTLSSLPLYEPCLLATSSCLSSRLQKMMTFMRVAVGTLPLLYPLKISESFPHCLRKKDFPVDISATAVCIHLPILAHRSLPKLGPMFLGACDFRQTSVMLVFHAPFRGQGLAIDQVSLAGDLAAKA